MRDTTQTHAPSPAERAKAWLIVGLLLAITTPFLLPAGVAALWIGGSLARRGYVVYALFVLLVAAVALTATVVTLVT